MRFRYDGTDVDFYQEEILQVDILTRRKTSVQRHQDRSPLVTLLGEEWRTVAVDFRPDKPTVAENVETLRALTNIMSMILYWEDGTTVAEHIPVRIDPAAPTYFWGGDRDAEQLMRCMFYETRSGDAAVEITPTVGGR